MEEEKDNNSSRKGKHLNKSERLLKAGFKVRELRKHYIEIDVLSNEKSLEVWLSI